MELGTKICTSNYIPSKISVVIITVIGFIHVDQTLRIPCDSYCTRTQSHNNNYVDTICSVQEDNP